MFTTNVKATHIKVTPDIQSYLDKRLFALDKLLDDDDSGIICNVELERLVHHRRGDVFRAEITLSTRSGVYRAEAKGENIEAAIDGVKSEVMRELRRGKRKREHLLRRGGAALKNFTHSLSARGVQVKDFVVRRRKDK